MDFLAFITFLLITVFFVFLGSHAVLFHLLCTGLLTGFVFWTGRTLSSEFLPEWIVITLGLVLYWFGLVIVRVMLTRSVSLNMLAGYEQSGKQKKSESAKEGIAKRLEDGRYFGLVRVAENQYKLTLFGRLISFIVATTYWLLRIK
jgi:hypothetical protein